MIKNLIKRFKNNDRSDEFFDMFSIAAKPGDEVFSRAAGVIAKEIQEGRSVQIQVGNRLATFSLDKENKLTMKYN